MAVCRGTLKRHPVLEHLGPDGASLGEGPALLDIGDRAPFPSPRPAAIREGGVADAHWSRRSRSRRNRWETVGWSRYL